MAKRIALIYLLIGLSWITISGWSLQEISKLQNLPTEQIFWVERWKGYFFVIVTTLIFYVFLHRVFAGKQKNDQQFRRMFDDNPNPMWVYDKESLRFVAVNQAMIVEYGYTREELLQMTIKQIRPVTSLPALENRLQEDIPAYSKSGIWCHQKKDGALFYVRIYSNATEYNGRPCRLVMAFDITPIIQAEQENRVLTNRLAKKERYLRSLINSQTTFLIRINTQGEYTFVNQAFRKELDYQTESLDGQLFTQHIRHQDKENIQDLITQCLQKPGKVIPIMVPMLAKQTKTIMVEWEFVAIKADNNKITELQGMGRDVTEEIESQSKIIEYTQRINDILESITDGFFAVDKNWDFTYVNTEFEHLLHSKRENILGNSLWGQFPDWVSLQFFSELQKAMHDQVKVHFEEYYSGAQAWFQVVAYPTHDGLAVFFHDITREKMAQEKAFEDAQNLNALINNPSVMIWSVDRNYRLITANQPFLDQTFNNTGVRPQPGDRVLYPELASGLINKWIDFYQRAFNGEVFTVDDKEFTTSNEVKYYQISFNPIKDRDGNIIGTGCFSRDITENKLHQIKIQEQNDKLKEIAWIQSHKVRVPVANILGLINAFNYKDLTDPFNLEVLANLNVVTNDLDLIIREIVDKTNEIEDSSTRYSNMRLMLGDRIDIHPPMNN
ncbi:PAS domain S-box protein [Adhaeribacter swui]|uniref:PAS domain S-box protein n=1 Tax=Adhaeribacter swui TaxID=2086471 RepID=A0A7G7GCW6_9BACT|nr:PAS domain-containing protein [Adhaeribacter swui]QNF35000.1 PAS domain S-box protein [Adhaeribacter swui]